MAKRKLSRVEVVERIVAEMPPIPQDELWSEEIAEFVAGHEVVLRFTDGMSNSRNDATVEAICQMVEAEIARGYCLQFLTEDDLHHGVDVALQILEWDEKATEDEEPVPVGLVEWAKRQGVE